MNQTSIHEDAGPNPDLPQWVKDLALLWLWYRLAATAPVWPLAWEPPYAVGVPPPKKGRWISLNTQSQDLSLKPTTNLSNPSTSKLAFKGNRTLTLIGCMKLWKGPEPGVWGLGLHPSITPTWFLHLDSLDLNNYALSSGLPHCLCIWSCAWLWLVDSSKERKVCIGTCFFYCSLEPRNHHV